MSAAALGWNQAASRLPGPATLAKKALEVSAPCRCCASAARDEQTHRGCIGQRARGATARNANLEPRHG
eukprot:542973-Pyramimonas_sp.AAC.1